MICRHGERSTLVKRLHPTRVRVLIDAAVQPPELRITDQSTGDESEGGEEDVLCRWGGREDGGVVEGCPDEGDEEDGDEGVEVETVG